MCCRANSGLAALGSASRERSSRLRLRRIAFPDPSRRNCSSARSRLYRYLEKRCQLVDQGRTTSHCVPKRPPASPRRHFDGLLPRAAFASGAWVRCSGANARRRDATQFHQIERSSGRRTGCRRRNHSPVRALAAASWITRTKLLVNSLERRLRARISRTAHAYFSGHRRAREEATALKGNPREILDSKSGHAAASSPGAPVARFPGRRSRLISSFVRSLRSAGHRV